MSLFLILSRVYIFFFLRDVFVWYIKYLEISSHCNTLQNLQIQVFRKGLTIWISYVNTYSFSFSLGFIFSGTTLIELVFFFLNGKTRGMVILSCLNFKSGLHWWVYSIRYNLAHKLGTSQGRLFHKLEHQRKHACGIFSFPLHNHFLVTLTLSNISRHACTCCESLLYFTFKAKKSWNQWKAEARLHP